MKKKLQLNIDERLEILYDLPFKGGTKETQRSFKELRKTLEPNDKEEQYFNIKHHGKSGRLVATANRSEFKEFEIEVVVLKELKSLLDRMEERQMFPEYGVDVHDQLVKILPKERKSKK